MFRAGLFSLLLLISPLQAQDTSVLYVIDKSPQTSLGIIEGIWDDVSWCLGAPPSDVSVPVYTAVVLVAASRVRAYGATMFNDDGDPVEIIIERAFLLHPTVLSHEIIHALTGDKGHDPGLFRCVMGVPSVVLEERVMSCADMAAIKARSTGC